MTSNRRRGTLIAGVILIALGVIFFLEIWSKSFSIIHFIGRYWPVLLIFIGASKLYTYFTWKEPSSDPDIAHKE
jgi:uncharacterized membrane protein HdeD (DUF308 family)